MAQSRADMATVGIDPTRPPARARGAGINPSSVNTGMRIDPELSRRPQGVRARHEAGEGRLKASTEETGGRI